MKKTLYTMTLASILTSALALAPTSVLTADAAVNASLSNTEFQASQDQDFTTTIFVPENSNIAAFEAVIDYDESAVLFNNYTACKDNNGTVNLNEKDGKLYLSYSATDNQTKRINVVDLTFHVNDDLAAGTYDFIALDSAGINNASSENESGNSTDYKLKSDFNSMTIYQHGDADLNGKIQSRDVTYLKQYIVKLRELSDVSRIYSNAFLDFEDDNVTPKINSRDAGIIQQKVVKMDVNLGDRVNVTFYDNEGAAYVQKSIKAGSGLTNVPDVPALAGFKECSWSLDPETYVEVDFTKISSDTEIYFYGKPDPYALKSQQVVKVLEEGFAEAEKYITDDFQLPYANKFGVFNMLSSDEFKGLDITWTIKSGVLAQSVNISKDYVVDVPAGENQIPYTTWVDFTANIYFNGVKYDTHTLPREIKGVIDMPSPAQFTEIIAQIPSELPEHYRLPGYVSLESERLNYGVNTVQNVDPFYGAPVVLIVLADKSMPTYLYDGSLVMGNLMLAAHAYGVDSCWIHRAKEEFETAEGKEILASLGITGDYEGIGHCILGYAQTEPAPASPRKENYVYFVG